MDATLTINCSSVDELLSWRTQVKNAACRMAQWRITPLTSRGTRIRFQLRSESLRNARVYSGLMTQDLLVTLDEVTLVSGINSLFLVGCCRSFRQSVILCEISAIGHSTYDIRHRTIPIRCLLVILCWRLSLYHTPCRVLLVELFYIIHNPRDIILGIRYSL